MRCTTTDAVAGCTHYWSKGPFFEKEITTGYYYRNSHTPSTYKIGPPSQGEGGGGGGVDGSAQAPDRMVCFVDGSAQALHRMVFFVEGSAHVLDRMVCFVEGSAHVLDRMFCRGLCWRKKH